MDNRKWIDDRVLNRSGGTGRVSRIGQYKKTKQITKPQNTAVGKFIDKLFGYAF